MAQKYISSRSAAGDPFDCRVHMEKNGSGEWEPASMLVRIGIGQKIISNINEGGGMAELEPFLKANRPDCWELIVERLRELAATVPAWFEEQRGVELCTLGIDVAITDAGDLHIFEINSLPFVDFNLGQVAMRRVAYYRWLADHHRGEHQ
ncbi:YheC/YheD family protein [Collinsella tanakaei]|uniref:YheC/YheD family protein n=1 Tax=Collinsella tanakaei TaxID=626935 RepID=UPI002E2237D8|nr:YheC/YheD family protein [Collinsella tanakaei]